MIFFFFFFNDTATTEIYTLSLHDALPIYQRDAVGRGHGLIAHLQCGQLELGLDLVHDAPADVHAVAHGLEIAIQVGKAERGLAAAPRDGPPLPDLGDRPPAPPMPAARRHPPA